MNLSDLLHKDQPHSRQQDSPRSSQPFRNPQARVLHDQRKEMASALTASPYISHSPVFTRSPQPPPSPPIEESNNLRTLPSIQSLIGMDVPPPTDEPHSDAEGQTVEQQPHGGEHQNAGHRSHPYGPPTVSNPNAVPPSPPIDPQLAFDASYQPPSATSSPSSTSGPQYLGGKMNNPEPHQQRQPPPSSAHAGRPMSSQATQASYQNSPYPPSPSAGSNYSYPSPAVTGAQTMYYQRPLPNNFPPPNPPGPSNPSMPNSQDASPLDPNDPSQWQQQHQHHHYIAPSSSANFTGPSQDRYVCQLCNKAFSRPSSLRIHSHSHTGEKPFLCPHKGCGKAFSVRSNMKRHERGCHGGGGSPGST